ncbi:MAG TPA: acetyl-CoA carboxylase carboxyltransferase subunit alpha, partial [Terriglobia bacterium]|nr:acetyl-CoA carboxylase carboxyltransferase subunit alpha [Terriglobia bacterium]
MAAQPKLQKSSAERDLEQQIAELKQMPDSAGSQDEIERLRYQLESMKKGTHASPENAEAWNRVLLARHPQRPYTRDYAEALFTDFTELHGDRRFGDDLAMVCGPARFAGRPVMIVGEQKGRDTKQKVACNFGMPKPEGYRKALRMMQFAAKFRLPIITFVDTPGAYPGIGAEERGQAEAIARSTDCCLSLGVPIISVIIGEGGSGGAVAIATANRIYMLEHAIYTVASPEAAASILWRDSTRAQDAATNMKITAQDLLKLGVVDGIIPEPVGGAH